LELENFDFACEINESRKVFILKEFGILEEIDFFKIINIKRKII
jgi:hypothetical protein